MAVPTLLSAKKRVNAFQAGSGDVFLISLHAGRYDPTAADYVIHMDPPESRRRRLLSDRAHRIGQQRPSLSIV